MAFHYDASEEERAAAAVLRKHGWKVDEPTCPLCHGWGTVSKTTGWSNGTDSFSTTVISAGRCPNGCPTPAMYLSAAGF